MKTSTKVLISAGVTVALAGIAFAFFNFSKKEEEATQPGGKMQQLSINPRVAVEMKNMTLDAIKKKREAKIAKGLL
ncbi:hypothetical protein COY27_00530 [Candidatus Woesearchaeota archaeon CG_4_10_14_0_2_um_filter_33_13]|nr:MAG: hypothetical protein COY27_00530 [Candidatus Woesearchaeota archaeon CG_4_10_14_0_2_um_filter_33_13]